MSARFNKGRESGTRDESGRFRPGHAQPGPGRPHGSRNRASLAVDELLDGEAEAITRRAIDLAKCGDTTAMRLCLERLCPPRKERPISVALPPIENPADIVAALGAIVGKVTAGEILPSEGQALAAMLELQRRAIETEDHEKRLRDLEAASGNQR